MIASLRMYERPENRASYADLWSLMRDRLEKAGINAPQRLDYDIAHDAVWARDDLLLAQICNLPFRASFKSRLSVLGAAHYDIPDTRPGFYRSYLVIRANDPAKSIRDCGHHRFVLNDAMSQSGWGAAHDHMARHGLTLNPALVSGSHRQSIRSVANGEADLAAIDAVCWRMDKTTPEAQSLRVIDVTDETPGQSFVTKHPAPEIIRDALEFAITTLTDQDRAITGLCGVTTLPASDYNFPLPPLPVGLAFSAA